MACQKKICIMLVSLALLLILLWKWIRNIFFYLEEWKYKIKKIQMSRFISTELDSESDSESDDEVMVKLKSDYDNDSDNDSE